MRIVIPKYIEMSNMKIKSAEKVKPIQEGYNMFKRIL